jgi:hypothetical protein
MEQDIDTNELGEAIVKKLKQFMTLNPCRYLWIRLIYDVMVNTDYEVKILMTLTS